MMITIPSMPTRFRPLPELELELDIPQLRKLAYVLDRVKVDSEWDAGDMGHGFATEESVAARRAFERAVSRGMNKGVSKLDRRCMYLDQYLGEVTLAELTEIHNAWVAHISRSIYEQIGA